MNRGVSYLNRARREMVFSSSFRIVTLLRSGFRGGEVLF
jgi:hypothetical protein